MNKESNGELSFLDTLLKRNNGRILTAINNAIVTYKKANKI